MDVVAHIRTSPPPGRVHTLANANERGARKITVHDAGAFRAPGSKRAQEVRVHLVETLNGWERHAGDARGCVGKLCTGTGGGIAWRKLRTASHAIRCLDAAHRAGVPEPDGARNALKATARDDLADMEREVEKAVLAFAGAEERASEARKTRRAAQAHVKMEARGAGDPTAQQWLAAMRTLHLAGDAEGLKQVAKHLSGGDPATAGAGKRGPGAERGHAHAWTKKLLEQGIGTGAAQVYAQAQAAECACTNEVIAQIGHERSGTASEQLLAHIDPRAAMLSSSGMLMWEMGRRNGLGVLDARGPHAEHADEMDRQTAGRANAHTQLDAHPTGVVAATRMRTLTVCEMGDAARAEQSIRWVGEALSHVDADPGTCAGSTAHRLASIMRRAQDEGAPVDPPDARVLQETARSAEAGMQDPARKRQALHALRQAVRYATPEHAQSRARGVRER